MCSGAWGNVRYIPIDNGIQQHGRAWRYMVGAVCISVYRQHATGQHGIPTQQGVYLCTIYDMRTQYTPAIARASQRPGACIACACVRALYYYIIIILLYYYIIIFIYTQYIQYTQYTQYTQYIQQW